MTTLVAVFPDEAVAGKAAAAMKSRRPKVRVVTVRARDLESRATAMALMEPKMGARRLMLAGLLAVLLGILLFKMTGGSGGLPFSALLGAALAGILGYACYRLMQGDALRPWPFLEASQREACLTLLNSGYGIAVVIVPFEEDLHAVQQELLSLGAGHLRSPRLEAVMSDRIADAEATRNDPASTRDLASAFRRGYEQGLRDSSRDRDDPEMTGIPPRLVQAFRRGFERGRMEQERTHDS